MQHSFDDAVDAILDRHPEYSSEAYNFLRQAMELASERFHEDKSSPHLSAEEVYRGVITHALEEYGPLARLVLSRWGVMENSDIGAIVYNLIEVGVLGRQEGDTPEQFKSLGHLGKLLDEPYLIPDQLPEIPS